MYNENTIYLSRSIYRQGVKSHHCQSICIFAESETKSSVGLTGPWMQTEAGTVHTAHRASFPHVTQWTLDRLLKYMDNDHGLSMLFKGREVTGF